MINYLECSLFKPVFEKYIRQNTFCKKIEFEINIYYEALLLIRIYIKRNICLLYNFSNSF